MKTSAELDIGRLTLETEGGVLQRLWLPCEAPEAAPPAPGSLEENIFRQLRAYLAGKLQRFDLPCAPVPGTPLQQAISRAIAAVPYGQTAAYSQLGPARVVGHVCALNPLPLIIPCHRIIPLHGAPGCYRGGKALKQHLLRLEALHAPQLSATLTPLP